MTIPAALLLQQIQIPNRFDGGKIVIDVQMDVKQKIEFYCPFFLRSIKSHFQNVIVQTNSTDIKDYEFDTLRKRLTNNPAYLTHNSLPVIQFDHQWTTKTISITVNIEINETTTRYNVSYWQRFGLIWIQYFSIFIIIWKLMDKMKNYMFSHRIVNAWEMIPWKKLY